MTTQEIKNQVQAKFGKAEGAFSVRANGVWLDDGVIEIDSVEAGFQGLFFRAIQVSNNIPVITKDTDEEAETALTQVLQAEFPNAENVWIEVM